MVNQKLAIEAQIQPCDDDHRQSIPTTSEQRTIEESPITQEEINDDSRLITTRLSKRRWAILFASSLFSLCTSITDEPVVILHTMLDLLNIQVHEYLYISQLFFYTAIVLTMPTAWFVDRFGIRMPMYAAIAFMFVRNFSRALLFNPDLPHWRKFKMVYWITSNVASNQVSSLFYCTPIKISERWFAASERSIAWATMMSISSVGSMVMSFVLPRIIHSIKDVKLLFYLNIVTPIISAIAVSTCITKSRPKYPPSERMIKTSTTKIPYFTSIKGILKTRNIILHLAHEATFEGVFIAIMSVLQDILISSGHSALFVGNLLAFNSLINITLGISLSSLVHRIQNITLACKLASLTKTILLVGYLFIMLYPFQDWVVYLTSFVFHIFRCWASPNAYNMTAHLASGLVSEATIAGFGSTLALIGIALGQVAIASLLGNTHGKSDYTRPVVFVSIVALINTTVYLLFFNGRTKKRVEEQPDYDSQSVGSNATRVLDLD